MSSPNADNDPDGDQDNDGNEDWNTLEELLGREDRAEVDGIWRDERVAAERRQVGAQANRFQRCCIFADLQC
jgi:hypothetical protein